MGKKRFLVGGLIATISVWTLGLALLSTQPNVAPSVLPTQMVLPPPVLAAQPVTTAVPQTEPMQINIPQEPVPDQAIVRFQPGTSTADLDAYIAQVIAQGGVISQRIDALGVIVIEGMDEARLPASAAVAASEPDYFAGALMAVPPSDPYYPQQWALPVINAPQGWLEMPADAPKVTVAVIDSGICASHADLAGRVLPGWDFVEDDADPNDTLGHGCGVAGIIAANVDDGIGIAGVAPNAMIMPLRALDGSGVGTYSDVAAAMIYAVDNGAKIINLSLGGYSPSSLLEEAVNYAVAHGVMVIAAAGNTGSPTILYPAAYEPVIAVGSVDSNLQPSRFSSYGQIDLWAPGRDIKSISIDGRYSLLSGTSFAAPEVAGVAVVEIGLGRKLLADGKIISIGGNKSPIPTYTAIPPQITPTETFIPTQEVVTTPIIITDWHLYTDPIYGYSLEYPAGWEVSQTPTEGIGGNSTFTDPVNKVQIVVGIELYDRPTSVSLQDWVAPNANLALSLKNQTTLNLVQGLGIEQTYIRDNWSGRTIYIPFGSKVVFVETSPADQRYNDAIIYLANSIIYPAQANSTQLETPRLYPEVADLPVNQARLAAVNFILPFSGKAKITQTGDGGYSHNCEGTSWIYDCQALDFVTTVNGMDGRIYAAEAGNVVFHGRSPDGYGNLVEIQHANGWVSWYAHLSSFEPSFTPSSVKQGQWLGMQGNTGCDTAKPPCGNHLHFMIKDGPDLRSSNPVNISDGLLPGLVFTPCDTTINCGWGYGGPSLYRTNRGWSQVFGISAPSLEDSFVGDNQATSVFVPEGWTLLLYPDINYGGTPVEYIGRVGISSDFGASSLKVGYLSCPTGLIGTQGCTTPPDEPPDNTTPPPNPPPSGNVDYVVTNVSYPANVSPGQTFQPEITVCLYNGVQLLESRGDMLRSFDNNLFGAFPHVAVRGTVNSGECYVFKFYNEYPITAPTSDGTYHSQWKLLINGEWVKGTEVDIAFTVGSGGSNPPSGQMVILFDNQDYGGEQRGFGKGRHDIGGSNFNDRAHSMTVPGGWSVRLYQDGGFSRNGAFQCFNEGTPSLPFPYDNGVSSLEVFDQPDCFDPQFPPPLLCGGVILHDAGGGWLVLQASDSNLADNVIGDGNWNDRARWLEVIGPWRATAYDNYDFGPGPSFGPWEGGIQGIGTNVSSVRVEQTRPCNGPIPPEAPDYCKSDPGTWGVYIQKENGDTMLPQLTFSRANLAGIGGEWNDHISQMYVIGPYKAWAYDSESWQGSNHGEVTQDTGIRDHLGTNVTSIRVEWRIDCTNPPLPPKAPDTFNVTATLDSISLSWNNVDNEDGYNVYKWNGTSFVHHQQLGRDNTTFTDSGLTCSEIYFYQVTAFNGNGESSPALVQADCVPNDSPQTAIGANTMPFLYTQPTGGAQASDGTPIPSCGFNVGKAVWYVYTPSSEGLVHFNTAGSDYDTILAAFTGTPSNLTELICNDDEGVVEASGQADKTGLGAQSSDDFLGLTSLIDVYAQAGTTYYIMVGGYNGTSGNLVFQMTPNEPPVLTVDEASLVADEGQTTFNSGSVGDFEGDMVQLSASVGLVTNNNDGTWSWEFTTSDGPAESQVVTITGDDGNGGIGTTTFTLTVNNLPPTATFTNVTGPIKPGESAMLNFTDPTDPSTADIAAGFFYSFDCYADGVFEIADSQTPAYPCLYPIKGTYMPVGRIGDKDGGFTDYSVEVVVANRPPVAIADATETPLNTPVNIPALANDFDPDGDPITITGLTDPAHGSALLNPDQTVLYTPDNGFTGTDVFAYVISDGEFDATTTITVVVGNGNRPPVAVLDDFVTLQDTPIILSVAMLLSNDYDPDGDPISIAATHVVTLLNGTAKDNGDGTFTFTPDAGFIGVTTGTYTITDGRGGYATGAITLTVGVEESNQPPIALDDAATTYINTSLTVPLSILLLNDSDPDGDPLTIVSHPPIKVLNGVVVENNDGTITYTPVHNFTGIELGVYTISDGRGGTATANVMLTVYDTPNTVPVAGDDAFSTTMDTPITITLELLLANDTDADGDVLTITGGTLPTNGTFTNNGDGSFSYTPNTGFIGEDSFTYMVSDGKGGSATATVTIAVAVP